MPPTRDPIEFNVSDLVTKFAPGPGDLLVLSMPVGLSSEEVEQLAEIVGDVVRPSGATVIFLPSQVRIEHHEAAEMSWLASQGLALRGYPLPGGGPGDVRYRVLHPAMGQLSDCPSHLEAIRAARAALNPGPTPPAPLEKSPAKS